MIFLLLFLLLGMDRVMAMEEENPFSPEKRAVMIRKSSGKFIILPYANCSREEDFSKTAQELHASIEKSIQEIIDGEKERAGDAPHTKSLGQKLKESRFKKNFYRHHGTLLIRALHNNSIELFQLLLHIKGLDTEVLQWKENNEEKSGTIKDYVAECPADTPRIEQFKKCLVR